MPMDELRGTASLKWGQWKSWELHVKIPELLGWLMQKSETRGFKELSLYQSSPEALNPESPCFSAACGTAEVYSNGRSYNI